MAEMEDRWLTINEICKHLECLHCLPGIPHFGTQPAAPQFL